MYEAVLKEMAHRRESYVTAVVQSDGSFNEVLRCITRIHVDSVARDPDYLRMEMLSALERNRATQPFFEHRWRPLLDYIEYSIQELSRSGAMCSCHPRVASLMFQGMLREALYEKCVVCSDRYREHELHDLVDQSIDLFFRAIGYRAGMDTE